MHNYTASFYNVVIVKNQSKFSVTPQTILVTILVIASFLIGSLYTKVRYLEQEKGVAQVVDGQPQQPKKPVSKYKSFEDAIRALAKTAKLDDKKLISCMNSGEKKAIVDVDVAEGNKVGVSGTPAFFINGRLIPGAVPLEEFKKVIDEELSGKKDPAVSRVDVALGNAPTQGVAGAPIIMIEYSDFQCPFCQRAAPTVKQVLDQYKGKILFAYKHYPLISIHSRAQKTAEASECARDQGKFWEFHDALFENQEDWAGL